MRFRTFRLCERGTENGHQHRTRTADTGQDNGNGVALRAGPSPGPSPRKLRAERGEPIGAPATVIPRTPVCPSGGPASTRRHSPASTLPQGVLGEGGRVVRARVGAHRAIPAHHVLRSARRVVLPPHVVCGGGPGKEAPALAPDHPRSLCPLLATRIRRTGETGGHTPAGGAFHQAIAVKQLACAGGGGRTGNGHCPAGVPELFAPASSRERPLR